MELIPKNKDKNKSKIFLEFKPLFAKPIINMAKTATKISHDKSFNARHYLL